MLKKNLWVADVYSDITPTRSSSEMLSSMKKSYSRFGSVFKKISEITNLPESILFSFAMVESGSFMAQGKSPGWINEQTGQEREYLGVMQISYKYADSVLIDNVNEYNQKERLFIGDNFGLIGDAIAKNDKEKIDVYKVRNATPSTNLFTKQEIAKTPANVFLGAQSIISLIQKPWGSVGNDVFLPRVIVGYNAGSGKAVTTGASKQDAKGILKNPTIKNETKNYIKNVLGNGGFLELWYLHFEK